MKSELTKEFLGLFRDLPERVKQTARKNYRLWKQNPRHPSVEFKKLNTSMPVYSVRAGIGWRVAFCPSSHAPAWELVLFRSSGYVAQERQCLHSHAGAWERE